MAINLFDFSNTQNMSKTPAQPGSFMDYLAKTNQNPQGIQQPTTTSGFIPKQQATKGRGPTNLFINERQALETMLNAGVNEEEAINAIKEKRQAKWGTTKLSQQESEALIKMANADVDINEAIKAVKEKRYDQMSIGGKIGKNLFDLSTAGPALVTEQVANVGSFLSGSEDLRNQAQEMKDFRKSTFENTIGGKAGTFITGAGELVATGPTKVAPTLLGRTAQGAMVGGVVGGANPVLEQGNEATFGDIGQGAVIGGVTGAVATPLLEKVAIPAIAGVTSKTMKYGKAGLNGGFTGIGKSISRDVNKGIVTPFKQAVIEAPKQSFTRNIPEVVVKRDLGFTPTERAKIEKIVGKTESQYILEKGLAGKGKEELAGIFAKQADDSFNGITNSLKTLKDVPTESKVATQALEDMLDQLGSSKKLQLAYADDIQAIQNLLEKGKYTLAEKNSIRRAFDKVNTGMYTAKGQAKSGIENAVDVDIRNGISKELQDGAKQYGIDIQAMNKELRAGLEMKDALLRRLSQEERNNFLGLQDIGVSAILSGGNPASAIALIGAKKYGEKIAPGLAQKAYNLNKTQNVTSRMTRGNNILNRNKSSKLGLVGNSGDNMVKPPVKPTTPKVINKPTTKTQLETTLKSLSKDNLDEVSKTIAKQLNTSKTAEIKQIITKYIKQYGNELKDKLGELIDEISEKLGTKLNLMSSKQGIGIEKTKMLSDDLVSEAFNNKINPGDTVFYKDKMGNLAKSKFSAFDKDGNVRTERVTNLGTDLQIIKEEDFYGKLKNIGIEKQLDDIIEQNKKNVFLVESGKLDYSKYKEGLKIENILKQIYNQSKTLPKTIKKTK